MIKNIYLILVLFVLVLTGCAPVSNSNESSSREIQLESARLGHDFTFTYAYELCPVHVKLDNRASRKKCNSTTCHYDPEIIDFTFFYSKFNNGAQEGYLYRGYVENWASRTGMADYNLCSGGGGANNDAGVIWIDADNYHEKYCLGKGEYDHSDTALQYYLFLKDKNNAYAATEKIAQVEGSLDGSYIKFSNNPETDLNPIIVTKDTRIEDKFIFTFNNIKYIYCNIEWNVSKKEYVKTEGAAYKLVQ